MMKSKQYVLVILLLCGLYLFTDVYAQSDNVPSPELLGDEEIMVQDSDNNGDNNSEDDNSEDEFDLAHKRMFSNKMTRFQSIQKYRPYDLVTREQAAHFFSVFDKEILLSVMDTKKYCSFDDLQSADPTLRNSILESCMLGLFQGSAGKFSPSRQITKAEALTVLIRALDGYRNESGTIRWDLYYMQSFKRGLTTIGDKTQIEKPITRYEMALLLYRASLIQEKRLAGTLTEKTIPDEANGSEKNNDSDSTDDDSNNTN